MSLLLVALKDLRLILRDRAALVFQAAVPVLVITIIASAVANTDSGSLLLPVVNDDQGPVAEVLISSLREHVDVVEVDREEAEYLVAGNKRAASALVFPGGLSKRYLGSKASELMLLTDPARGIEVETVKALLMVAEREADELADPFAIELLSLNEQSLTADRASIPPFEQHVPGFSLMFVLMGALFGLSYGIRDEHEWGTLTRLRVAPIPAFALLGGKMLARFVVGLAQLILLFVYGHFVFDISVGRSVPLFLVLMTTIVFCLVSFSLLVSAFAKSREQIVPLGLAVVMLVCSLGGCWWPLYQEPDWLRQFAWATPMAWGMDGIHDLILRDRGLPELLPTLGALSAYGTACLLLGLRLHRFAD